MNVQERDRYLTPPEECGCCHVAGENGSPAMSCAEKSIIFTPREQEVLGKIRQVSQRARELKQRLGRPAEFGTGSGGGHLDAAKELEDLRRTRQELEHERIAAAEERMRLLGHA